MGFPKVPPGIAHALGLGGGAAHSQRLCRAKEGSTSPDPTFFTARRQPFGAVPHSVPRSPPLTSPNEPLIF